jgi:hypothetical protein
MPILLAWTIEFVHIEQVSALFTFRLGQVLLYFESCKENSVFHAVQNSCKIEVVLCHIMRLIRLWWLYRKMYQVCVVRCVQHLAMKGMEASE